MDRITKILCGIDDVLACPRCTLALSRTNVVVGDGPADAKVMLIGEAPGRNEDRQGKPFVGSAGKILNSFLEKGNVDRSTVYITNVVKCRPPGNRVPKREEIEACSVYLRKQLEIIAPEIIVLLGKTAAESYLGRKVSMATEHGKPFEHEGRTVIITYHPASVIYNRKLQGAIEDDFKNVSEILR
ncbi:MAG: Uracil DNA glycosylase superfamily protein [Methanocella sp. PtaU1.Bin125]|nr:MAG: Uracil DNA glycosylase superfamily protein [Methanocella sp. PtaU1.Bin125]